MEQVQVPCPSCSRPMNFRNNNWQCFACNPIPTDVPICKTQTCLRPLTKLGEPWNCWICLTCHDHPSVVNKRTMETELPERKYIDEKMTEDKVRELIGKQLTAEEVRSIVCDTMAEFMIKEKPDPDYPAPKAEKVIKPETWREKAKRLGVSTNYPGGGGMRKKDDVLKDIERVEKSKNTISLVNKNETLQEELRPEEP